VTGVFTYGLSDPANVRNSADLGGGALRDMGVYPIGTFRFATGLEPVVTQAEAEWEERASTRRPGFGRGGRRPVPLPRLHAHDTRQEMVFEGDGGWLVVRAPFNAGEYGQAT
jgi:predicted dehydrogenase